MYVYMCVCVCMNQHWRTEIYEVNFSRSEGRSKQQYNSNTVIVGDTNNSFVRVGRTLR